ncbi:hypothetical protein JSMCR1_p635 (plasmid) [Escherichia coli]|nr:hypothetical protein JSMCR1_p635 [Escherichia coli]
MQKSARVEAELFCGSVATYDANRIVKCGSDEYNFYGGTHRTDLSGNVVTSGSDRSSLAMAK